MRWRLTLVVIVLVAVLGGSLGGLLLHTVRERSEDALRARLLAIAVTAAQQIDGDLHEGIRSAEDPAFLKLRKVLRDARAANGLETEVYTLEPSGARTTRFVVMTNAVPYVGATYRYRTEMKGTFVSGEGYATRVYGDEHGHWISAYAPIRASDGRIVGLLEVDETAEALGRLKSEETWAALGLVFGCLVLGSVLALLLSARVSRRLEASQAALEENLAQLEEANAALEAERVRQALLTAVAAALNRSESTLEIAEGVLGAVLSGSSLEAGVLYLREAEVLRPLASLGVGELPQPLVPPAGLAGRAASSGEAVRSGKALELDLGVGRTLLDVSALPIAHGGEVVGVLAVGGREPVGLEQVLAQVGVALVHAEANERTRRLAERLGGSEAALRQQSQALEAGNRELREANRYKSEFIANMSHEFRTPLNAILGYADLVELSELDAEGLGFLERLRGAGRSLLALINDLLSYARLEAGMEEVLVEPLDLGALLGELGEHLEALAKPGVRVAVEVSPGLSVSSDGRKLRQVITNLAGNAAKFTEEGQITLRASAAEGGALLEVIDTGCGIPQASQEAVFEAFRQVDGSATRSHGGTGLGLAIVTRLSLLLGGRLGVQSEAGKGSTFSLWVPGILRSAPPESALPPIPSVPGRPRAEVGAVLLLAAPGAERGRMQQVLEDSGARVRVAADPYHEALGFDPDAVVLDLGNDVQEGLAWLAALRASPRTCEVPVVVVTSAGKELRALEVSAQEYVAKPCDPGALRAAIERCLGGGKGRILVIDDDLASRELTAEVLARAGYPAELAEDGVSGLAAMRASPPAAVVLDLMMPGMSGFDVLQVMGREPRLARLPVVVLTAKELSASERDRLRLGVAALVQKASVEVWPRLVRALTEHARGSELAGASRGDLGVEEEL